MIEDFSVTLKQGKEFHVVDDLLQTQEAILNFIL